MLLQRSKGSEELKVFWWSTCADLLLLRLEKGEWEKDEIVKEGRFSLQRAESIVLVSFVCESAEKPTLFRNDVTN